MKRVHEIEEKADNLKDRKLAHDILWLRDRLFEFMQLSANLILNQKDNDEAVLHKMALEHAQNKIMEEPITTITVCDACLRACCWHGELMCGEARTAGTKEMSREELEKLKLEHPRYWEMD
jgi:hypothetical protein